jgi:signal transduction histidine kinase/DNA-binding response OmpR family regulator
MFYIITKSRGYLYHGVFISGVFIFTADFFGITPDLFFIRDNPKLIQGIDYIALAMGDLGYFQFIRVYLGLSKSSPKWNRRFRNIAIAKLVFFVCIILFHYITYNEPVADKLLAAFILLGFVFIILFLIWYPEKSRKQYFLLAGTLFLFLAISLNAISIISEKGLLTLFTEIGLAAEIAIFSIALAYRRAVFIKEEQKAQYLLEMDAFKNKFYTNITHEFRTPLTIINGMTDMAKEKLASLDSASIFRSLTKIRTQSDNVLKLVNQMLNLSKLESKSLKFTLKQKDLVELIQMIVKEFEILAIQKEIDLVFKSSMENCYMDMDEEYLRSVLANLLSNALKFTKTSGKVDVLCESKIIAGRKGVWVAVKDTGIGIKEEQLEKIFDRFYQVDAQEKINYSSTGVGLSLSMEIIQLMEGEISVESKYGEGSEFQFWIPITQEQERVELSITDAKIDQSEVNILLHSVEAEKPIVLIIDDYEEILDYLESILQEGYTVEKATNGMEGLKKAEQLIPDIIISDVMMPFKDGFELCNDLKTNEKTDHIPIILLTAKSDYEDRIKGWNTGADVYLTKPFSKEELFAQIKKLNTLNKKLQKKYSQFAFIENKSELKKENTFIHNIHSLLDTHLGNADFSVEQLAKCLFMSRMQLHRKIKALSNKSASQYIRSYRMHKAKIMLKNLNQSIGAVAFDIGYEDPSYFSKSFHQEFGITPSGYRDSLK